MSKARCETTMMEWSELPWRKLEQTVFKLQKRIFKASQRGDRRTVRKLQKTLMRSWSGKCLAVRRVTQDNQGKKTAGVDGVKSLRPVERFALINHLAPTDKAKPTRRVWIPKPGTEEKRPLGIPTMRDRAVQALVKQVLEPEWEAKFEPNSYGFRPGRSVHDAIGAIFSSICHQPKYVLDADIAKCFDRINHDALLTKLNTFPTLRRQIKAWLQAGVLDGQSVFPTPEGTPQGGVISPLLANVALHGMEACIRQAFPLRRLTIQGQPVRINPAHFVRYADDFVILHERLDVIQQCQQLIAQWLEPMGLALKPSKTRIAHTLLAHEGPAGFDFLGFTVRQFPAGKSQAAKNQKGVSLGCQTLIRPSREAIRRHQKKLKSTIAAHRALPQRKLINALNPVIRGWTNYFSAVSSKRCFSQLGHWLYGNLQNWARHRHPHQGRRWVSFRYWLVGEGKGWQFATRSGEEDRRLQRHSETPIRRHAKVQAQRSPYDGDWVYWSTRMGRHPEVNYRVAALLKRQKGKCPQCRLFFTHGDKLEVDHKLARRYGGQDNLANLQLLHRHCHKTKTVLETRKGGEVC